MEQTLLKISNSGVWFPFGWYFVTDRTIPKWSVDGLEHKFFEYDENDFIWLKWKGVIKENPKRIYYVTQVSKRFQRNIGELFL